MKEKLLVVDVDYVLEKKKPVVRLFCKNENGKTVLVKDSSFKPYFYVMPKEKKLRKLKEKIEKLDTKKIEAKILKVEAVKKIWQGKKTDFVKITIDNPRRIADVRDKIKRWKEVEDIFEYAIVFYKRYLIDKQIEPMNWISVDGKEIENKENLQVNKVIKADSIKIVKSEKEIKFKILAFDTEWIDEKDKSKLIMLSLVGNTGYKKVLTFRSWRKKANYVEVVKDEKELIERFIGSVRKYDPDFLCSYNGDNFDLPKLKEKASELKISLKLGKNSSAIHIVRRGRISSAKSKGRVHVDLFNFIDHILSPSMKSEVLTLDEVSQEFLSVGKKKMKYKEMVDIWRKKEGLGRLAEYNLWDSELTLKLANHLLPQIFAISRLTGLLPFDASRNTYSQIVEAFLTKRAFINNVLIPNRPKTDEMEKRRMAPVYRGAIVIEPKKGIHENILAFDFRSLYPTIIVTHNISPETFTCGDDSCKKNKVPEMKWCFCTKKEGFVPKHLRELIKTRQKIKEEMEKVKKDSERWKRLNNIQYALKIIANATYGYFGFFGAKWYKRECAASAAAWGRYYIKQVIDEARKEGLEIIYGDTDSLMVKFPEKETRGELKKNGRNFVGKMNKKLPGIIELEFRDLYKAGIFVARKSGKIGAKKRYALINYKGEVEIRGFETVRRDWCELSKRIQRKVLVTILKDRNPAKAIQLVRDAVKKIREMKVDLEDLTIFEQITRPLSQYQQIGPHVKAAQKAKARGRVIEEGTVIGFVIVKGVGKISDRAEPVEDVKPRQYDPEYYIGHQIIPAAMRVLGALGYTEQEVLSGKTQKKLEGFLKRA